MITFDEVFETAISWYNGMDSALYKFVTTHSVDNEEHRQRILDEVQSDMTPDMWEPEIWNERLELEKLSDYVRLCPVGIELDSFDA